MQMNTERHIQHATSFFSATPILLLESVYFRWHFPLKSPGLGTSGKEQGMREKKGGESFDLTMTKINIFLDYFIQLLLLK